MTDFLKENPSVKRVCASQGSAPARYCMVRPMTSGGECYGELVIDFDDYRTAMVELDPIRESLREKCPDAYIRIRKYNLSIGTSHPVEVEFSGPDASVLRSLSARAEAIMRGSSYMDPYSVQNNWKPSEGHLKVFYNASDAQSAGISRADVANAIAGAYRRAGRFFGGFRPPQNDNGVPS